MARAAALDRVQRPAAEAPPPGLGSRRLAAAPLPQKSRRNSQRNFCPAISPVLGFGGLRRHQRH